MNGVIQILAATLGSCGFAIVFQIKPKHIKFVAVGGALSWFSYLLFYALLGTHAESMFLAAVSVTVYSEVMARIDKVPATLIYIPAIIPLIPGGHLYYSTGCLIAGDESGFRTYSQLFLGDAVAVVLGTVLVYTVLSLIIKKKSFSK